MNSALASIYPRSSWQPSAAEPNAGHLHSRPSPNVPPLNPTVECSQHRHHMSCAARAKLLVQVT